MWAPTQGSQVGAGPWFRLAWPICLQARSDPSRHVPTCPLTSAATARTSTPVQDHPTLLLAQPLAPTPVPEGALARATRRCDRPLRAGVPSGPRGAGGREAPASRTFNRSGARAVDRLPLRNRHHPAVASTEVGRCLRCVRGPSLPSMSPSPVGSSTVAVSTAEHVARVGRRAVTGRGR